MTTQTELFPITQLKIAEAFLAHFEAEVKKTSKAMTNAQVKVAEALKLREMAEHEVTRWAGCSDPLAAGREMKHGTEEAGIGSSFQLDDEAPIVITEPSVVDPITGEVESGPEPNVSVVVLYPDDDEPHVTKIGEYTRYSELVADYLTEAHLNKPIADYYVLGEDDGKHRSPTGVIVGDDYGKRLLVIQHEEATSS